jgi:hypothetical protein
MSRLYDDNNGFSVGSGSSVPVGYAFHVKGISGQSTGGYFSSHQGGTGNGFGLVGNSIQTSGTNVGVHGLSGGIGAATNIGIKAEAGSATNNYSIQLIDGTQATVGRYLRNMTTDGKANWANIQVSEVTGAVSQLNGTNNYVAKFTPDGSTIGRSQIQDDGTSIGIGNAPSISMKIYATTSTHDINAWFTSSKSNSNYVQGLIGAVTGSTNSYSIGVEGRSLSPNSGGNNIGGWFRASSGTLNHSVQLQDGTEASGKFLKSVTANGRANWAYLPSEAQIMCSDMASVITASTTTNASTIKAYWVAPCDGTFTDMFASLFTAQVGGAAFTVVIRASGSTVGTLTFVNGQNTSPIITSTSSFSKGNIYGFYVTQAGDGSARGLLVTLNYLRV